jgi:hypothetical protein
MLAALSFKVGYIFGGIALSAVVWTFFFLPETKVSAEFIFSTGERERVEKRRDLAKADTSESRRVAP